MKPSEPVSSCLIIVVITINIVSVVMLMIAFCQEITRPVVVLFPYMNMNTKSSSSIWGPHTHCYCVCYHSQCHHHCHCYPYHLVMLACVLTTAKSPYEILTHSHCVIHCHWPCVSIVISCVGHWDLGGPICGLNEPHNTAY